jgi:hypothetical protein
MADPRLVYREFRPGVNRELTRTAGGDVEETLPGWYDVDKVRFRFGKPEKIGGWINLNGTSDTQTFSGMSRALISWNLLNGTKMLGFGTNKLLYVWDGGTYYDITPITTTVSVSNGINTTSGSAIVKVSCPSYTPNPTDYVIFINTSVTVGGNVLLNPSISVATSGIYTVNDPVSAAGAFNITYVSAAAATSSSAGGDFVAQFLLPVGLQSAAAGFGWGVDTWGASTWGTPRSTSLPIALRTWSLDTFGEDLVANPRAGKIYTWDATGGTASRATWVTVAPSVNNFIITSQEARHLISLGCTDSGGTFDPLNIRWCSAEDLRDWVVSATNTAGEIRLSGSNEIVGATRSGTQILIWTDDALYGMTYNGANTVFDVQTLGNNCGLIGPHAAIEAGGKTYWMSKGSFYYYDGNVNALPCDVFHFVFDNLDHTQGYKVFAGINSQWNEIIWFYQTTASTTSEIDRYVIYNYLERTWTIGTMTRTAWVDESVFDKPIAGGTDGKLYEHEVSVDADGSALPSYAESNDFDIDAGDEVQFLSRYVPDFDQSGNVYVRILTRKWPGSAFTTKGPYLVTASSPKIDLRARGRQAVFRVDTSTTGATWRLGTVRLQIKPDGRR